MHPAATFRSKKEVTYDYLHDAIRRDELKPGSRLVIDDLANQLGVSQIPIREALQQLQADGFVVIEPYVGARVTKIDVSLVGEIFDLLEALETISAREACTRMTEEDLTRLKALLDEMERAQDDCDRFSQANVRFHQLICDCAGMPLVKSLMGQVLNHWGRLRCHCLRGVFAQRIALAQQDHRHLFEAMRSQDPVYVEQVIREHNQTARRAYESFMGETCTEWNQDDGA